jgi:hypothetical protein
VPAVAEILLGCGPLWFKLSRLPPTRKFYRLILVVLLATPSFVAATHASMLFLSLGGAVLCFSLSSCSFLNLLSPSLLFLPPRVSVSSTFPPSPRDPPSASSFRFFLSRPCSRWFNYSSRLPVFKLCTFCQFFCLFGFLQGCSLFSIPKSG